MGIFEEIWSDVNLPEIDKLGYTQDTELDMVSRYENEDVQKIYFVDKDRNHPLRFFNIIYNEDFNNYGYIDTFGQSDFNIIPKVELSKIEFAGYTGGSLRAGMVTYAYQQYKRYGVETSFSETSLFVPISSTINKTKLSELYGSDREDNCGIGVKLKIENLDEHYDNVRVLAFDYSDYNSNPSIRIIYENRIKGDTLNIVDNGSSLGTYDLSTFRIFNQFFIKPKVLAVKNNILFAGNVKEEYFDLDIYLANSGSYNSGILTTDFDNPNIKFWDSRVYRFYKKWAGDTNDRQYGWLSGKYSYITHSHTYNASTNELIVTFNYTLIEEYIYGSEAYDPNNVGSPMTLEFLFDYEISGITYTYQFTSNTVEINTSTLHDTNILTVVTTGLILPEYDPDNLSNTTDEAFTNSNDNWSRDLTSVGLTWLPRIAVISAAIVRNSDSSIVKYITTSNGYHVIPYDFDAITNYNLVQYNSVYYGNPLAAHKWSIDGNNLGGDGENVHLRFATEEVATNEYYDSYKIDGDNPSSDKQLSWQRDEIYRFSIQFMDNLGRKSYPKWILDCRMPNHGEEIESLNGTMVLKDFSFLVNGTNVNTSNLYPSFSVLNVPKNPDGTYMKWRILVCKREMQDKTVLGVALVAPTITSGIGNDWNGPVNNSTGTNLPDINDYKYGFKFYENLLTVDHTLVEIISPDIIFNNLDLDGAIVQIVGALHSKDNKGYRRVGNFTDQSDIWELHPISESVKNLPCQFVEKLATYEKLNTPNTYLNPTITSYKKVNPKERNISKYNIKDKTYRNMCVNMEYSRNKWAEHGTCVIAQLNKSVSLLDTDWDNLGHFFALIKKDTIPYGGNSYTSRFNNQYIPASEFIQGDAGGSYHYVKYGDTYISMFDYMRAQYSTEEGQPDEEKFQEIIYFPVESQINLRLRNDDSFSKIADSPFYRNAKLTENGLVDVGSGTEISKLYQYNTVYSKLNNTEIYSSLPYDTNSIYSYDSRIRRSQIKFDGEYTDSWLKFLQNDYLDVDSQYGELVKLEVFKNRLLFFQNKGFGIIPVGEKELLSTKDTTALALGTGGILNRFDYISDKVGISYKKALITTPNALYLYSNVLNTLYRYEQNLTSLTDSLGMNSWFDEYVDISKNVLFGYNPLMSELLFQFEIYGGNNVEILVYNELTGSFVYFYPIDFSYNYRFTDFITANGYLYSMSTATLGNRGYKHNYDASTRNYIHEVPTYSSLNIIVSPQKGNIVTFNVLEFLTNITNIIGGTEVEKTIDKIQITNDYQDTGTITLVPTGDTKNIKKRFRSWRFSKLRDNKEHNPKLKSGYIKIHIEFNNIINKKVILKNITTNYSVSNIIY